MRRGHALCGARVVAQGDEAPIDVFEAERQHELAFVEHQHVGEQGFELFDLVRRDEHAAFAVTPLVDEHFVEGLARQHIQAQRGLVKDHELRIDGGDEREVHLHDHAFGQGLDLVAQSDAGAPQELARTVGRETRMQATHQRDELGHSRPARQDRHVGDVASIAQQLDALLAWRAAQHLQFAVQRRQADHGAHQAGLARAVVAKQAHDTALGDDEADVVDGALGAIAHAQVTCFNEVRAHGCASQSSCSALMPRRCRRSRKRGHSW